MLRLLVKIGSVKCIYVLKQFMQIWPSYHVPDRFLM